MSLGVDDLTVYYRTLAGDVKGHVTCPAAWG